MKRRIIKPKNIMAIDLRTPKYKLRMVESKKNYKREKIIKDKEHDFVWIINSCSLSCSMRN